jgi:hypothetical protein
MEYIAIFAPRNDFLAEILFSVCVYLICFRTDFSLHPTVRQARLVARYAYQMLGVSQLTDFFKSHIDLHYVPRYPQLADFNEKTS